MSPEVTPEDQGARAPESEASSAPDVPSRSLLDNLQAANEQLVISSMNAQEQAEAAQAEAERAHRLKDEFIMAVVSHELRTPLSAILGWVRLLVDGRIDPAKTVTALQTIERNAKVLERIIDDLMDISRVMSGKLRIETQPLDLVTVVQAAIDEVRVAAESKGLHVKFTCPAAPGPVTGDAMRLQQVVANLLSNAVKFTPPGGQIEIRLGTAGSEAEIQVIDTGQGIDAAFLPHVFDRFVQADTSTTRSQGGLGLGLAIVRAIVEQHGGHVQAESPRLGHGSTFTVRLPVRRQAADAEPTGPAVTGPPVLARLDGIRVLVVEDNPDGREFLTILLEGAGAKIASAASVREALDALEMVRPDVIVSDIGMPDVDGYEFIRRVRQRPAECCGSVPAVALTGYIRPEDRARLLAAGFQRHLRKPVDPDEIVATVAALAGVASR